MKIESRYIIDKTKAAEFEEVRDSEAQFFADLANIITPEALEEGIRIDFGSDKRRFTQVVEMLALDEAIQGESPSAHIHNATTNDLAGSSGFHGGAIEGLKQLPIAEMPDVIQSGVIDSYKRLDIYHTLQPRKMMITAVIVTNIDRTTDKVVTDLSKPGVVVGVMRQYLPEFREDEYGADDDLAKVIHSNIEKNKSRSQIIVDIAGRVALGGYELANPESNYFIEIGPLRKSFFVITSEITGTGVGKDGYYTLVDGRFELYVNSEDRDVEVVLPELVQT